MKGRINQRKEPSIREVFLRREQARSQLLDFLGRIWLWPTRKQFPHFLSGPEGEDWRKWEKLSEELSEQGQEEIIAKLRAYTDTDLLITGGGRKIEMGRLLPTQRGLRIGRELQRELTADRCFRYLSAFFRILEQVAINADPSRDKDHADPSRKDLAILLEALNERKHYLHWETNRTVSVGSLGIRDVAERLLGYLGATLLCGPVHDLCAECLVMFVRRQGARKFCQDCSKKHRTYQYRKEYLLKKKRDYYERDFKRDKPQKGTMHGKTES